MHEEALIHGSCIAIDGKGVLLLGAPGAGKSDLVLRLLDHSGSGISGQLRHARMVADDQVAVRRIGDSLSASAPAALAGKLEIRGLGTVNVAALAEAPMALAVRLTPAIEIERMPELDRARMDILGISIPLILIDPEKASAPARIRAALDHFQPS
ncbi:HPr kinase/phosphorylase [Aestuariivirga sp.]|uniref:HPr kinase/phosphorylase n=1 Tax=Aestuariivirga sp. TaxID=2650926 RepID=UPI003593DE2B